MTNLPTPDPADAGRRFTRRSNLAIWAVLRKTIADGKSAASHHALNDDTRNLCDPWVGSMSKIALSREFRAVHFDGIGDYTSGWT